MFQNDSIDFKGMDSKLTSRRILSFVLVLFIVLSAFDAEFYGVKLFLPLLPLTFLFPRANRLIVPRSYFFILPMIGVLAYGYVLRVSNGLDTTSTLRFSANLLLLSIGSRNVFLFLATMNANEQVKTFSSCGKIFFAFMFLDLISSIALSRSVFAFFDNSPETYLLGQILSTEPNWVSFYLVFFTLAASRLLGYGSITPLIASTVFQLGLNPSRIALASLLAGMAHRNSRLFILVIVAAITLYVSATLELLPRLWVYDLGPNIERNPRIFDFLFINDQIMNPTTKIFGSGFGDILHVTETMTWRENYLVSNQLWLQIFVNYGYLGVAIMLAWAVKVVVTSPRRTRTIKILLFVLLQFHNALFLPAFWVIVALIKVVDHTEKGRR